ncbi:hypothetical protein B9Z55_025520 [Caenorhabditis nigoni]|uniref:Uncharacterized protein n=1 Tax=Caenorhabditis nigoni TaxID=1611254 RepID=A0A2G5SZI7_9PELO|nr:hypothetical protein B9Z55_025520 [Caenorhabditis nigoni]
MCSITSLKLHLGCTHPIKPKEQKEELIPDSYAYTSAFLILVLFAAVIWCHVASARKSRRLAQFEQRGAPVPPVEWSPLLQERKNLRPPPPYSQVV